MEAKDKNYPLYPPLSEEGQKEAQNLINSFKDKLKSAAEDVITALYCDTIHYIESDSWGNFRNQIMDGYKNYDNRKIQAEYSFKEIRQSILKHHKEEIVKDLNQDLLEEIRSLKETINYLQKERSSNY